MYTYHYQRRHQSYTRQHDTLEQALDDATGDIEFGLAFPVAIRDTDGRMIYGIPEIHHEWFERYPWDE